MSSACFHFPTKIMNSRNSSFSSFNVVHTSIYLFVCLFVRVKHGRDYHSMYLSRGSMFNFLLEQIAQLLSFNLFFSFNRLSWIFFFLARTIVNWRCVSVTKNKKKEKNGLLTKYCKVSLCLNVVFMKFAYDIHTLYFPTVYDSHLTIGHGHSILSKIK